MLNTISPHIIVLPELTLSYTVKQNVIYQLLIVINIHYNSMLWGININNTITPYSENIASYCDIMLITFNTIYNDVDVIFLHCSY